MNQPCSITDWIIINLHSTGQSIKQSNQSMSSSQSSTIQISCDTSLSPFRNAVWLIDRLFIVRSIGQKLLRWRTCTRCQSNFHLTNQSIDQQLTGQAWCADHTCVSFDQSWMIVACINHVHIPFDWMAELCFCQLVNGYWRAYTRQWSLNQCECIWLHSLSYNSDHPSITNMTDQSIN